MYMLNYDGFMKSCKTFPQVIPRINHILSFAKACMNFASGMTGFTNDLLVLEMEDELQTKKSKKQKLKANRFHELRDGYAKELRKMNKVMDNIKKTLVKLEKGQGVATG